MKRIYFNMHMGTGFVGATHHGEDYIDFKDDATQEEIDKQIGEYTQDTMLQYLDIWHRVTKIETFADDDKDMKTPLTTEDFEDDSEN